MRTFNLSKLFFNKKFLVTFSIVFAFLIWLGIYINENPTRETTIKNIPISISANKTVEDLGLDIVGSVDQTVSVTISGPNYIVSAVSAGDILVEAKIPNVTSPNEYDLELVATKNGKSGYTIVGVTPSTVKVKFDYFETKTFDVEAIAIGASAADIEGYEVKNAQASMPTIEIRGPKSVVEKINKVQAVSQVNKVLDKTENFENAELRLLDFEGYAITDIAHLTYNNEALSSIKLSVTVPIYKKVTLPVTPVFSNIPDGYSQGVPYTLSESSVVVEGSPDIIDTLTEIKLKAIDFANIKSDNVSFEAALDLPTAVYSAENLETVTVTLSLGKLREREFNVNEFVGEGLMSGLSATFEPIKNVKICGQRAAINKLSSNDLYAVADLSNVTTTGSHTASVKIVCKTTGDVWAVGNYTVSVKVK